MKIQIVEQHFRLSPFQYSKYENFFGPTTDIAKLATFGAKWKFPMYS